MLKNIVGITFLIAFVFFIKTIYDFLKKKNYKKPLGICVVAFIVSVAVGAMLPAPEKSDAKPSQALQKMEESKQNPKDSASIEVLKTGLKVPKEKAKQALNILKAVGFTSIDKLYGDTEGAINGAELHSPDIAPLAAVVYTTKEGAISKIIFKNNILYENGNVKGSISDSIVKSREYSSVINSVERQLKKLAHDPSSVELVDGQQSISKAEGLYTATGFFRAKNSFGALTMHKYKAQLDSNFKVLEIAEVQ